MPSSRLQAMCFEIKVIAPIKSSRQLYKAMLMYVLRVTWQSYMSGPIKILKTIRGLNRTLM